ncbi:UNVERIFIED_ORG: hypothetical protein B5F06_03930 [Lacrimispora saccharolytica]
MAVLTEDQGISSISACRAAMAAGVSSAGRQWFCRLSENQELSASGKRKKTGQAKSLEGGL